MNVVHSAVKEKRSVVLLLYFIFIYIIIKVSAE